MASKTRRVVAILKSSDIDRTQNWYTRAGFTVTGRHPETHPTWCEVERDGVVLQFLAGATPWPAVPSFTGCFYVHTDDVEAVFTEVGDLVEVDGGIEDREWGARELVLCDPDGYFVTFTEPAHRHQ